MRRWSNGRPYGDGKMNIGSRIKLFTSFDLDCRNRLNLIAEWYDKDNAGLGLAFGNGNSDPVWSVVVEVKSPPRWIGRWLNRRWDRQVRKA